MKDETIEYLNGWAAHQNKIHGSDNPYDEQTQQASFTEWENGWCARYSSGDLEERDNEVASAIFGR